MKKKLVGILVCLMMVSMIPVAAGMMNDTETQENSGIFAKTTVRGVVLGLRLADGGNTIKGFALRLHYRQTTLGETKNGVLRLAPIEIPNNFNGYIGKMFIFGTFRGCLDC